MAASAIELATAAAAAAPADEAAASGALQSALAELTGAGGDLVRLVGLARCDKSALTAALKDLGFRGLRKRQQLQKELEALAASSGSTAPGPAT